MNGSRPLPEKIRRRLKFFDQTALLAFAFFLFLLVVFPFVFYIFGLGRHFHTKKDHRLILKTLGASHANYKIVKEGGGFGMGQAWNKYKTYVIRMDQSTLDELLLDQQKAIHQPAEGVVPYLSNHEKSDFASGFRLERLHYIEKTLPDNLWDVSTMIVLDPAPASDDIETLRRQLEKERLLFTREDRQNKDSLLVYLDTI